MRRIWIIKKENQPYGHQSSGCIFKNPTPDVSAGTLIDQAGLKGTRVGGAEVSDRHANFIVAEPGAIGDGRAPPDRPDPPARLAAVRLRAGAPAPDLVTARAAPDVSTPLPAHRTGRASLPPISSPVR